MEADVIHCPDSGEPGPVGMKSVVCIAFEDYRPAPNELSREQAFERAAAVKQRLSAAGIAATLHEFRAPRDWSGATVMGPDTVEVMVTVADSERAQAVVGEGELITG